MNLYPYPPYPYIYMTNCGTLEHSHKTKKTDSLAPAETGQHCKSEQSSCYGDGHCCIVLTFVGICDHGRIIHLFIENLITDRIDMLILYSVLLRCSNSLIKCIGYAFLNKNLRSSLGRKLNMLVCWAFTTWNIVNFSVLVLKVNSLCVLFPGVSFVIAKATHNTGVLIVLLVRSLSV